MNRAVSEKELLDEIEVTRSKMNHISKQKPRTSNEVVRVSTYLDQLLNKYQLLNYQKCMTGKETN